MRRVTPSISGVAVTSPSPFLLNSRIDSVRKIPWYSYSHGNGSSPNWAVPTCRPCSVDCAEAADANTVGILRIALLNKVSFSLPRISASGIKTVIPGTAFVFCISSAYKLLGSGYPS